MANDTTKISNPRIGTYSFRVNCKVISYDSDVFGNRGVIRFNFTRAKRQIVLCAEEKAEGGFSAVTRRQSLTLWEGGKR